MVSRPQVVRARARRAASAALPRNLVVWRLAYASDFRRARLKQLAPVAAQVELRMGALSQAKSSRIPPVKIPPVPIPQSAPAHASCSAQL